MGGKNLRERKRARNHSMDTSHLDCRTQFHRYKRQFLYQLVLTILIGFVIGAGQCLAAGALACVACTPGTYCSVAGQSSSKCVPKFEHKEEREPLTWQEIQDFSPRGLNRQNFSRRGLNHALSHQKCFNPKLIWI
jgi:hypothetical protein